MKNGTCPKCNSSNVFKKIKGVSFGSYPIRVNTGGMMVGGTEFDSYVCVDCGYFENYILDTVKLEEVKNKWTKV
jgi:predicted nucleic-acid-binding Zn-ribbon protein